MTSVNDNDTSDGTALIEKREIFCFKLKTTFVTGYMMLGFVNNKTMLRDTLHLLNTKIILSNRTTVQEQ